MHAGEPFVPDPFGQRLKLLLKS